MQLNRKEIARQLIHLSGVLFVVIPWGFDLKFVGAFLLVSAALTFLYSEHLLRRHITRKVLSEGVAKLEEAGYAAVKQVLDVAERPKARPFKGMIMFGLGVGVTLLIFPPQIAIMATIALGVGDSFSTLVGIHFGRHKLPRFVSKHRSWEGTLAAFVSVLVVASFYAPISWALMTSTSASVIEAFDTPFDDNVLIPIGTGVVLTTAGILLL